MTVMKTVVRALVLLLALSPTAFGDSTRAQAKQHFQKGAELFVSGELARALSEFEGSYRLNPVPEVLFNIALVHKGLRHNGEAVRALQRFIQTASERTGGLDPKRRVDAETEIATLRAEMASLVLKVAPPTARILIDGREPDSAEPLLYLDAGTHRLEVTAVGHKPRTETLTALAGKTLTVDVTLEPESAPMPVASVPVVEPVIAPVVTAGTEGRRPFHRTTRGRLTIGLGALSVTLLVSAAALGGTALSVRGDYRDGCDHGACDGALYDRGHALAVGSDVTLGLGIAAAAATALVALLPVRHGGFAVAPQVAPGAGGLAVLGSFP